MSKSEPILCPTSRGHKIGHFYKLLGGRAAAGRPGAGAGAQAWGEREMRSAAKSWDHDVVGYTMPRYIRARAARVCADPPDRTTSDCTKPRHAVPHCSLKIFDLRVLPPFQQPTFRKWTKHQWFAYSHFKCFLCFKLFLNLIGNFEPCRSWACSWILIIGSACVGSWKRYPLSSGTPITRSVPVSDCLYSTRLLFLVPNKGFFQSIRSLLQSALLCLSRLQRSAWSRIAMPADCSKSETSP